MLFQVFLIQVLASMSIEVLIKIDHNTYFK